MGSATVGVTARFFCTTFFARRRSQREDSCDTPRMSTTMLPDLNLLPAEALKALVRAQHEQLLSRESEIEHLKLLIAKLQRMQFGRKSEKLARQIEQLELRLEDLQAKPVENAGLAESQSAPPALPLLSSTPVKPARRPLPDHLPRQTQRHEPKESACPDCGGAVAQAGRRCLARCWSMCPRASSWFAMCGRS